LDTLAGLPVFEAHVEDGSYTRLALQLGRELGGGLNDIDLLGDAVEEQALGNSADAGEGVSGF
jgi:hypothetical protein